MKINTLVLVGSLTVLYKVVVWSRYYRYLKSIKIYNSIESLKAVTRLAADPIIACVSAQVKATDNVISSTFDQSTKVLVSEVTESIIMESIQVENIIKHLTSYQIKHVPISLYDKTGSIDLLIENFKRIPLQSQYSLYKPHESLSVSTFKSIIETLFRRRYLGSVVEENVLHPKTKLFAILESTYNGETNQYSFSAIEAPYQFSKAKFLEEISKAKTRVVIYGCATVVIASVVLYFGINYIRKVLKTRESVKLDKPMCCICFEANSNQVFLPCSHICCCEPCSENMDKCPVCRHQIDMKKKLHFA